MPLVDIDTVVEHGESVPVHHACGLVRLGDRATHCGYLIRKPTAESITDAPGYCACGSTMQRVDENGNRCAETRPAAEPRGVRQMGMDDVGLLTPKPAMKA